MGNSTSNTRRNVIRGIVALIIILFILLCLRLCKHDEEEGANQAQPFVMLPPSGFFHFVFVDNVSVGAAVAVCKLN